MKTTKPIKVESGIHTFEVFQRVSGYHYVQRIIDDLYDIAYRRKDSKLIRLTHSDKEHVNARYEVSYDFPEGISMIINKSISGPRCNIRYIINPSALKDRKFHPEKLYAPQPDTLIEDCIEGIIQEFNCPSKDDRCKYKHPSWNLEYTSLTISRIDLTWNLYFEKNVNLTEIIRLFKKSYHKDNFRTSNFGDERDYYSFRIISNDRSQMITVYDKIYEIKRHRKNDDPKYDDLNILRIEISIKRPVFIKLLNISDCKRDLTFDQMLHVAYTHREEILQRYSKMMFHCTGKHLSYDKAKKIIEDSSHFNKDKERMLFFMDKVSNSDTYGNAIRKTKKRYGIGDSAVRRLESLFDEIDVNPVTFLKDSKMKSMDSFYKLIQFRDGYKVCDEKFLSELDKKLKMIGESMK